ncbi:MAG: hypothetical protein HY744_09045 [Deltaproteobacteria bacterium]|nr:hypothetical protein [Deltaproteobacteria bacterium]
MRPVAALCLGAMSLATAGCELLAGIHERGICTAPARTCLANAPAACSETGHDWIPEAPCSGTAPVCSAGECVLVAEVALGESHTCVRLGDGTVRCWGQGADGQLGNGDTANSSTPREVPRLVHVAQIAAGGNHTCALLDDGRVSCWGNNEWGQVDAKPTDKPQLTPLEVSDLLPLVQISLGAMHTCGLAEEAAGPEVQANVICWGNNEHQQCGEPSALPQDASKVEAGGSHTCALLADGAVACWGANESGQLGIGTTGSPSPEPMQVKGLWARDLELGGEHSCAVDADRGVSCWGANGSGQLGLGDGTTENPSLPTPVVELGNVWGVSLGGQHTCAYEIDLAGETAAPIKCWGDNKKGQVGIASKTPASVSKPRGVSISDARVVQMALGSLHSCARLVTGRVACWGANEVGQLGDGTTTDRSWPHDVAW